MLVPLGTPAPRAAEPIRVEPPSWRSGALLPLERVDLKDLPPVDVQALLRESAELRGKDVPQRVGHPMKAGFDTANSGTWEDLDGGDRVWRLRVRSRGALWIVFGFGTFRLQQGGGLYVYAEDRSRVLGPFGAEDVRPHGQLWFPPLAGDTLVAELYWPKSLGSQEPNLHLGTVSHGYLEWGGIGREPGQPQAGACNNDVNCPLGADWQDEKRGVVNMLSGGSGYCTGSLIATTDQDCRNLVLTAAHCLNTSGEAAGTTYQFNFERPACNSGIAPTDQTVTGSSLVATYSPSDMTLVELDVAPPDAYSPFYNGWTRSTNAASESWAIHHPSNDEKAISHNVDPLIDGINYGPDHWRVTEWEDGTTEPGSSGSPMFDQNHRIVGQLHGGQASCTNITWDEYGKLDVSWSGGGTPSSRLQDWLDPGGGGAVIQDGIDFTFCNVPQPRLSYFAHTVDDAAGNGDGIVDPGEPFVLQVTLENAGTLDASQVSATLSSATAGVTISDDLADWPGIPQGGATRLSNPPHFDVRLAADHACGDPLAFHLDITAAENPGAWGSDFSVPTGTEQISTSYRDDMEQGANGWTQQTLSGANPWAQSSTSSRSPATSWAVSDIATVSDSVLLAPVQASLPAGSELSFWHRHNSESTYDGGVLEYSTDGGASWLDAGPLITQGGYNSTISTSYSSPIGGRQAWSGDSVDFVEVRADLSSLAGADVHLRWRFATDSSVSDEGWYVDDVVIETRSYTCNPPLARPGEASDPNGGGAPFTVNTDPGGFLLEWSAPLTGGTPDRYKLYRTDLFGVYDPQCEADLGASTSIVLSALTDNSGFLVVARNGAGEGAYGSDSTGNARSPAAVPCP